MKQLIGFLSVVLMSKALSAAPICPELDIQGKWKNKMGQEFTITQDGCETIRLFDLNSNFDAGLGKEIIDWRVDLNSKNNLSPSYVNYISKVQKDMFRVDLGFAGNTEALGKTEIQNSADITTPTKRVQFTVKSAPLLSIGRFINVSYDDDFRGFGVIRVDLEIIAVVTGSTKTVNSQINKLRMRVERIRVKSFELGSTGNTITDKILTSAKSTFTAVASAILNHKLVLGALSDELVRK